MEYHLDSVKLRDWFKKQLTAARLNDVSTDHLINSIVLTSLRGVDSHGINLFPHYLRAIGSERIKRSPEMKFDQSAPGTATLDADHAVGHHAGAAAIQKAIEMAKVSGISAVGVKNSTHFGSAAYFALMAPPENMIGFAFTNADALVKAFRAKEAFFGTNPICCTAPLASEEPFCLDMSTSLISFNKIVNFRRANKSIANNWAFDSKGIATTDPHEAKSLNPIGDFKGFGLGMMVDILCSTLIGTAISKDLLPMYTSPIEARRRISHFFMAIDIQKFINVEFFKANLQAVVDRLRALEPLDPETPVMVPGDPEKKQMEIRKVKGIPMDPEKFKEYLAIDQSIENCLVK